MLRPEVEKGIAVIGGGVCGVTTAVLLRALGYRTVLYARQRPSYDAGAPRPEGFATLHAAASVLPHSVASPHVARWTSESQAFFRALCFRACAGVRTQVHYEIFEDPPAGVPEYAGSVENFALLTEADLAECLVPRRSGAAAIHGWSFDAFFADAPAYVAYLYALYEATGGSVREPPGDGTLPAYLALDHAWFVNCTGIDAHSFLLSASGDQRFADLPGDGAFEALCDPVPAKVIRGHYLRVDLKEVLTGVRGRFLSYSYKPSAAVYRSASGAPADAYCYPRSDAWLLGGSRQEGRIGDDGAWVGEETVGETMRFARPGAPPLEVPAAILRLNADIVRGVTGGRLDLERLVHDDPGLVAPGIGYRFVRDSETDSVRVGCSRVSFAGEAKYVVHNYGHGGAGFTLSWGCAMDVLRLIGLDAGLPVERQRFPVGYEATRQMLAGVAAGLV